jgi:hypothetical protein
MGHWSGQQMRFIALSATILSASLIFAESATAEMSFSGAGAQNCGQLISSTSPSLNTPHDVTMIFFTWIQGFLSGMNAAALNLPKHEPLFDLAAIPADAQWRYVVAYCQTNQSAMVATAALDLGTTRLMHNK